MARSRSPEAHDKVIHAALTLFGERGIDATSMDAIARNSGVSKATIYNHWPDKESLLMEVMLYVNGLDREPEDVNTGDLYSDLATVLNRRPPDKLDAARTCITPMLVAYAAVHREFGDAWRHRVMEPPRRLLKRILGRGIDSNALPAGLDLELSIALLMGPLLYRHIFSKSLPAKLEDIGSEVAAAFCRAYQAKNEPALKTARKK